ncbi:MAG TPA: acetyltransferase [Ferruginibacter sp.]|nr:acetyltransferase [Ferruginibacter sp.]
MVIIGYSGHAFVVCGILRAAKRPITGYCDKEEKSFNPFALRYYGSEHAEDALREMKEYGCFIAIGINSLRNGIYEELSLQRVRFHNVIHPSAVIDTSAKLSDHVVMVAANATINPLARIGTGVICNTGCIIEHECIVEDFAHIGPGAVLCGNVTVGRQSFIGANAVIRQGITIGANATIGAGSVVISNVPDNVTVVGVPAK